METKDAILQLANILARHGVIDPCAIDDPEGYDGGLTMDRVAGASQEICMMLAADDPSRSA